MFQNDFNLDHCEFAYKLFAEISQLHLPYLNSNPVRFPIIILYQPIWFLIRTKKSSFYLSHFV